MARLTLKSLLVFTITLALALAAQSWAQQQTVSFDPAQWQLGGSAALAPDGSVTLTPDAANQYGNVVYAPGFCAKEFKLSFEMNLGNTISNAGGLGVAAFVLGADSAVQYRVHADTFYNSNEDTRYELNDNHVSIESLGALYDVYGNPPKSGTSTFGPFAAGYVPFRMKGIGWIKGEIHKTGGQIEVSISNGSQGLLLSSSVFYAPGALLYPGFEASTSSPKNLQSVRNMQLQILDRSDCPDYVQPLDQAGASAQILNSCGDIQQCPPRADYAPCVETQVTTMLGAGQITSDMSSVLLLQAQLALSYCDGRTECIQENPPEQIRQDGYNNGYAAGVASVDTQSFYNSGFAAGKASVDVVGLQAQAFADGAASIDQAAIRAQAYAAGQTDGYAAGESAGYDTGFAAGKEVGYSSGQSAGYANGFNAGQAAGYASGYADGEAESYADGYQDGLTAAFDAFNHPRRNHLVLEALCSPKPKQARRWRIKNSLPVPLLLSWEIFNSSQKGNLLIGVNREITLETKTVIDGPNVMRLFVLGQLIEVRGSGGRLCR